MAFGNNSARRSGSGFGGGGNTRGVGRPAAASPQSGGHGGGDKPKATWTTCVRVYDPYHSALEVQVVSEWYRTALGIRLSPVYAERRGPDDGNAGGGKKYDYDSSAMVVLDLHEAIVFRHQLEAFIDGKLAEVTVPRLETKRLVLASGAAYFEPTHPEYALHSTGLAVSIEDDGDGKSQARTVVFISRQQTVKLADDAEPVALFPELQALLAVVDSYIGNCARVDFGSVRLIDNRDSEPRPVGPPAPMPARRTGGLGTPARTGIQTQPQGSLQGGQAKAQAESGGQVQGQPQKAGQSTTQVNDADIDAALGGPSAEGQSADDVLGDVPKF